MITMKKFVIYAIAALALGSSLASCTPEEKDLFDQSSAERLNAAVDRYRKLLCSAPNGWCMEYFVNNDWEPGYVYLMKFDKSTAVKIAADNVWIGNKYTESTSVFDVIADDGPVLTFNTFNPIFHLFATPDNVVGNGAPTDPNDPSSDLDESGYGHRGDYEFVIEKGTDDMMVLRGKKWGLKIIMRRMADDADWKEYMAAFKERQASMFSKNTPDMRMVVGGKAYVIANMASGVANIYPEGGDAMTETIKFPYIMTENGFRMVRPFRGMDSKEKYAVQSFAINEGHTAFVCSDEGQEATISNYEPAKWLFDTKYTWASDADGVGGRIAEAYAELANGITRYGTLRKVGLRYDSRKHSHAIYIETSRINNDNNYYIDIDQDENGTFSMSFTGETSDNANILLTRVPAVGSFIEVLTSATYTAAYPDGLNAAVINLTATDAPDDHITVSIQ